MILLDIFLFPRIKLVTITQTWSFWASVFHKALVYFAGRWWFALWRRNHQESIFSKVLDALYWAQAKCSEISAQYDLWKSFKRAAWQVCTCHLVLSYNEPVCLIHINDVCFFSYVFFFCQLQVVVQLPEREAETGERQVCHRSNIRGGEQLSWESTCVYAQGKVDISCIFMFIWRQHCVTKLLVWFDGCTFIVSSDAEDMDRLLSVHGVSMQNYTEQTDIRSGVKSAARYPASSHLALVSSLWP